MLYGIHSFILALVSCFGLRFTAKLEFGFGAEVPGTKSQRTLGRTIVGLYNPGPSMSYSYELGLLRKQSPGLS